VFYFASLFTILLLLTSRSFLLCDLQFSFTSPLFLLTLSFSFLLYLTLLVSFSIRLCIVPSCLPSLYLPLYHALYLCSLSLLLFGIPTFSPLSVPLFTIPSFYPPPHHSSFLSSFYPPLYRPFFSPLPNLLQTTPSFLPVLSSSLPSLLLTSF
jgi:hypothetical protein